MVGGVTVLAAGLFRILNLGNVALLYLLPVMAAASLFGLRAGLFAGLASSIAYNFVFLPPTGTLTISNPENVVTIVVLLGVAFVTSQFAARVRSQADLAAASARANAALAEFLRRITASANDEEIAQAICGEVARLFDVQTVMVVAADNGGVHVQAAIPPEDRLDTIDQAAASWTLERGLPAGRGSDTLTASDWLFHPIRSGGRIYAALGVARGDGREPMALDQLPLLMSLLDQAALGLERARLESEMRDVAQLKERDRLRAALLSSVSHDLRTPLTTIMAASAALPIEAAPELIASIRVEADRLSRFVANLLDMARVEAGALHLNLQAVDLTDAVGSAVHDTRRTLAGHEILLDVPADLPLVKVDPQLLHHCLINLLDNAGRYATAGSPITIRGRRTADALDLSILDEGPGLPAGREEAVFDTFTRFEGSDQAKGGTGLGLAIVKGFAEAMGMTAEAQARHQPPGACFTLNFPQALLVREYRET
jgi:two-component system sensor histidine kinase KdpD